MIVIKKCLVCHSLHYPSYAENIRKKRKVNETFLNSKFVAMTKYTVFESLLLKKYSAHLFYNQASFVGFVNAYNHLWIKLTPHDDVANRFTLTNQCLSDSWFYYSYIEIAFEYGLDMNHFYYPSMEKLDHTLEATRNKIVGLFLSKWSKVNHGTKCSLESCEEAMVLDGQFISVLNLKLYVNFICNFY